MNDLLPLTDPDIGYPILLDPRYRARIDFLMQHAFAERTRKERAADLLHYLGWGGSLPSVNRQKDDPTPQEEVLRYLADHATKHKHSTIARRIDSLNAWHRHAHHDLPLPGEYPAVRRVLRGIRRHQAELAKDDPKWRLKQAPPLLAADMARMVEQMTPPKDLHDYRDRALFLLAWSTGLREHELRSLKVWELRIEEDGMDVMLGKSKTDQNGMGVVLAVPRLAPGRIGCPCRAMEEWLRESGITNGPVFRSIYTSRSRFGRFSPGPMPKVLIGQLIKHRLMHAGVEKWKDYSAHSFRAGMITQGVEHGPPLDVQQQSRHASHDVFMSYVRRAPRRRGTFVEKMLEKLG